MKQVIVIRKDLKLSVGKIVAQAVHAAQRNPHDNRHMYHYINTDGSSDMPIVVVCYVTSEQKLMNLYTKCNGVVPVSLQHDGGKNEVVEGTVTALSIGPYMQDHVIDELTKRLQCVNATALWGLKCDMDIDDMSVAQSKILMSRLNRKIKKAEPCDHHIHDELCKVCLEVETSN